MKSKRKYYHLINGQKDVMIPSTILPKKSSDMTCLSTYFTCEKENVELLEKAFNIIVCDNDAFRIRFAITARGFRQYFTNYKYIKVPVIQIENENVLEEEMRKCRSFEHLYTGGSLCNAYIFTYDSKATILINTHHVVIDGYGLGILFKEFVETYTKLLNGTYKEEEKENKYTFEEFIDSIEQNRKSDKHKKDIKYYRERFNKAKDLRIISPILRPTSKVETQTLTIDDENYSKLIKLCEETKVPIQFSAVSIMAKALLKYTKQSDICFYYLNHGRPKKNQKNTIGNMVGSCMAFFHHDENQSLNDYIKESYFDYLKSTMHGNLSAFEYIFCGLKTCLKTLRFNYFAIVVSCLNLGVGIQENSELKCGMVRYKYQPTPFYFTIQNDEKEVRIIVTYQSTLISKDKLNLISNEIINCIK